MKVFVTGGSGLVGRRLVARLLARGDSVSVLSRDAAKARAAVGDRVRVVAGDPCEPGPWTATLDDADAVVHLAGENLFAHRWSAAQKKRILESRTKSTELVARNLPRAATLVSASAVGIYGPREDDARLDESAPAGGDFLARVCADWEAACEPARAAGARVVNVRTGVVLDASGGALGAMLPAFKSFVGGPPGSGRQWLSWIHADDLASLYLFALDRKDLSGPLNATAPEPVRMKDFAKALGRALGRPSWAPVPRFALRLLLGEVADVIVTGQRVVPSKALALGFRFAHPELDEALASALARERAGAPAPLAGAA